ncbi:MAG: ParB N-terminal domain-containing protein, partial [Gammaproteobacteria bacterium]|nr:ParB N-terminal domain-containing protein [Gammaproteobacteria bacterium]
MPQRPGLGKGLDALIPSLPGTQSPAVGDGDVLKLSADAIVRNPRQPRKSDFNQKDLDELARSIKEHGIIQPLIVS